MEHATTLYTSLHESTEGSGLQQTVYIQIEPTCDPQLYLQAPKYQDRIWQQFKVWMLAKPTSSFRSRGGVLTLFEGHGLISLYHTSVSLMSFCMMKAYLCTVGWWRHSHWIVETDSRVSKRLFHQMENRSANQALARFTDDDQDYMLNCSEIQFLCL